MKNKIALSIKNALFDDSLPPNIEYQYISHRLTIIFNDNHCFENVYRTCNLHR